MTHSGQGIPGSILLELIRASGRREGISGWCIVRVSRDAGGDVKTIPFPAIPYGKWPELSGSARCKIRYGSGRVRVVNCMQIADAPVLARPGIGSVFRVIGEILYGIH